eukprot:Opistho-1_new@78115
MQRRRVEGEAYGCACVGQGLACGDEDRDFGAVKRHGDAVARAEVAVGGDGARQGYAVGGGQAERFGAERGPAGGAAEGAGGFGREHVGGTDEIGHETGAGIGIDLRGCADLRDLALVEDGKAVCHRQRLALIVGDEDEGDAKALLQGFQLVLHRLAQLEVQRAEGFVEQQHAGFVDQRPRQRHTLALPARKLRRLAVAIAVELDQRQHLLGLGLAQAAVHALDHQPVSHVVAHRHMRKQRVILKHRIHVAPVGRNVRNILPEDADAALRRLLEPRDQPQTRRLARPRRPEHGKEAALGNGQIDAVDRFDGGRGRAEVARDGRKFDGC